MAPKKKTVDKVPAGTGDAADSGSTSNVIGGNDPTLDLGKDPSQMASAVSETNTIRPTTQNTCATDQLAHLASEQGTSEDPTQTPTLTEGAETHSSLKLTQITLSQHMDEVKSIHNMSRQAAQLLVKTNESNSALEARTRTLRTQSQLIAIREKYPTIAKGKSSMHPRDPTKDPNNEDIDPHSE
ncbi:hypothetical protein M422DRAFT_256041 [Sphaerobolus stellatus SS14]|uniref:Uncharacterized protein n=1 Tax=Sphaerobolus stellatus (strain SS14) TaxID=990650 RepID=A0A0C9VRD8_SPHS4|nr:hypothetical protein M422DRAFT_256041 [Sphaerobolus stellatus SS14]